MKNVEIERAEREATDAVHEKLGGTSKGTSACLYDVYGELREEEDK